MHGHEGIDPHVNMESACRTDQTVSSYPVLRTWQGIPSVCDDGIRRMNSYERIKIDLTNFAPRM